LFQSSGVFPVAQIPDLEQLLQLPCCHPCSPVPNSVMKEGDDTWPKAGFLPSGQAEVAPAPGKPAPVTPLPTPKDKNGVKQTSLRTLPPMPRSMVDIPYLDGTPLVTRLGTPTVAETAGPR